LHETRQNRRLLTMRATHWGGWRYRWVTRDEKKDESGEVFKKREVTSANGREIMRRIRIERRNTRGTYKKG